MATISPTTYEPGSRFIRRCETCGSEYSKKRYTNTKQWAKQRFCSQRCSVIGTIAERKASRKLDSVRKGQQVVDGRKVCSHCGEMQDLSCFFRSSARSCRSGFKSRCKVCENLMSKRYPKGAEYAKKRIRDTASPLNYTKRLADYCACRCRKHGVECSISAEWMWQKYQQQGGLCAYSGFPMTHDLGRCSTNISIERIDPSLGYVPDNVVLCCLFVNLSKRDKTIDEWLLWADRVRTHLGRGS